MVTLAGILVYGAQKLCCNIHRHVIQVYCVEQVRASLCAVFWVERTKHIDHAVQYVSNVTS